MRNSLARLRLTRLLGSLRWHLILSFCLSAFSSFLCRIVKDQYRVYLVNHALRKQNVSPANDVERGFIKIEAVERQLTPRDKLSYLAGRLSTTSARRSKRNFLASPRRVARRLTCRMSRAPRKIEPLTLGFLPILAWIPGYLTPLRARVRQRPKNAIGP